MQKEKRQNFLFYQIYLLDCHVRRLPRTFELYLIHVERLCAIRAIRACTNTPVRCWFVQFDSIYIHCNIKINKTTSSPFVLLLQLSSSTLTSSSTRQERWYQHDYTRDMNQIIRDEEMVAGRMTHVQILDERHHIAHHYTRPTNLLYLYLYHHMLHQKS
jgi:hypothetical protein